MKYVIIALEGCGSKCPYYRDVDNMLEGPYTWCIKKNRDIVRNENKNGFPRWCPLENKR